MAGSFCFRPTGASCVLAGWLVITAFSATASADDAPAFFRGLNLNGPAVVIDGQAWEGSDSKNYVCSDKAFAQQNVALVPSTDADRAMMIRSSRWGGNRIELTNIPAGTYSVFLYVWEDNNAETYSITVNDRQEVAAYNSGSTGHWDKLGPWYTDVNDGRIVLTSKGGAANFSGVELWRGRHDGSDTTPISAADLAFFESRIRPLLAQHCYECHSAESEELQGELLLDSRPTMRRGGATGPSVVPGDPDHSLLIEAVRFTNSDLQMPPDARLADQEIADLEQWVRSGAPDPRADATRFVKNKIDVEAARRFWSLKPVADPPVPTPKMADWAFNDIDRFILSRLELHELRPVADAGRRTWIRRATYDLTGLPPTPAEIESFVADGSPQAFETVVERLLASRHYGERWGRHWMDLVRYADTAGDNSDYPIPEAYLYRNYIIDSFNADKPYDRFLCEQIAGDLLPAASDQQRNEQIIATGYLAISRRFGSVIENYPQHLTIEDTIDNLGRTVLGMTLACARCHDHKFDPISQDDYYGIYGILQSTRYPFPGLELDKKPRDFAALYDNGQPGDRLAYAMTDGQPADAKVHLRGDPARTGDDIARRFPEVLGGQQLSAEQATASGRLQLAEWLTSKDNPLTARVMANRIWQYHFGSGLVATPSDFGVRGLEPTHPQLLDWLAARFMEDGWSIRQMHRRIMLSHTYRLDSQADPTQPELARAFAIDPANELHWRFTRQRLDAEELRDTLLFLSGELDDEMPMAPHPFPPTDKWEFTQHHPFRDSYDTNHRSVYLMTARLNARPFFTTFDGADRNASTAVREHSVTTVQSLYLLNDDIVHRQAAGFAARLIAEQPDASARISLAFAMTTGRDLTAEERQSAEEWFTSLRSELQQSGTPESEVERAAWESFARVLFRLNEFLYVD